MRAQLDALTTLERADDAAALCDGQAQELLGIVVGTPWLRLSISCLLVLAGRRSQQLSAGVAKLARDTREIAASLTDAGGLSSLEIAFRLNELASGLANEGFVSDAVEIGLGAWVGNGA